MPKKPKDDAAEKKKMDHEPERSNWENDQKERGYYYDDAHGYQTYDPLSDDNEEEKANDRT